MMAHPRTVGKENAVVHPNAGSTHAESEECMPFGFGSRSKFRTPSEKSQQSKSNTDTAGRHIAGELNGINANDHYKVYHKWRKVGSKAKRTPHHSQIFVATFADNQPIVSFGLFQDDDGLVEFRQDEDDEPTNPYHVSSSDNPIP